MCHKIDNSHAYMNLRNDKETKFKKAKKRKHELYLKGSLVKCSRIWETLSPEIQKATTKVKFKTIYVRC